MLAQSHYSTGANALDETSCQLPCQHPSCWASQRRQETGLPHKLPPVVFKRSSLSDETGLPVQSILNLLSEYGQNNTDGCPESPRESWSHPISTRPLGLTHPAPLSSTRCQQRTTKGRERTLTSKPTSSQSTGDHLHLVELADCVENRDSSTGCNQPCGGNQLYIWLPNTKKMPGNFERSIENEHPQHLHMKDITECMMPEEVDQKRQSSILFADWPTLKKKRACNRHQRKVPARGRTLLSLDTVFGGTGNLQRNINCPWMTVPSQHISHGQLSPALHGERSISQLTNSTDVVSTISSELLSEHRQNICGQVLQERPEVHLDTRHFSHDALLPNRVIRYRSRNTLPGNYTGRELTMSSNQTPDCHCKVASVSLDLPKFSVYNRKAKPFSYGKQDLSFYLGPIPVSRTKSQNRFVQDNSDQMPEVGSGISDTLLMQQTTRNFYADGFILDSRSPPLEMQVKVHDAAVIAGSVRSSPAQEHQLVDHLPDNHMAPELVTDTSSNLQETTARRHTEAEPDSDRQKPSLDDDRATAESPAPPPPSPEPRD